MPQPYDLSLDQLRTYKPGLTRQHDFDDFWEGTLDELSTVPMTYDLVPYSYPVKGVMVYRITFSGFLNAPIDGWLALPAGEGPHPGLVLYHGYNWAFDGRLHETVNWALRGYASLQMLVRGQQGDSVDNVVPSHGGTAGWMTKGIMSPEEYYYRAVYMDAVRAIDILASLDQVDAKRIAVAGDSQGGALTLAAAALSDLPALALAEYPYLSNFERAIDLAPKGPYLEINEYFRRNSNPAIEDMAKRTLSYFDVMNLASRIQCHTWMCVGLVDEITPPSTVFAAYNHLQCSKEMHVYRYFGHEPIPATVEPRLQLLKDRLQS
ncbi:acetylxylan esterase [Paenibacillus aurantius]|uniref:Acetylxylan esterase n=1 Tax=Paenibacillus aurantius TaxID=2918900 RepID=A0AA96LE67_9BACL|nr:acetylxylan esterase [Paenibacillus aurantius]WNQ12142.1 acetylxylan esterase [Paenibacillus aurantius]